MNSEIVKVSIGDIDLMDLPHPQTEEDRAKAYCIQNKLSFIRVVNYDVQFDALSIEVETYPFKTKPYAHQRYAFNKSKDAIYYGLFMDMGTGKTKVAIDTAAHLYLKGEIDTLVVFGNKGSYKNWVTNEIPTHMPDCIPVFSTHWESTPSILLRTTYELLTVKIKSLKVFVMNIEALAYPGSYEIVEDILKNNVCMTVIDESTTIKNEAAARSKAAHKLARLSKYRRILTGEPIANSPMDIWSQAKFLGEGILGFTSFFAFRSYYAKIGLVHTGHRVIKKVQGFRNIKELERTISEWSYRIKKEDCLDLPPKIYQMYKIELTEQQTKLYENLKDDSVAQLSKEITVSAPLAITKLLRLHQLICGHMTDDTGNIYAIPNNRITGLMTLLEEVSGKAIIWATYREDIKEIANAIKKEYGSDALVTYFGDTGKNEREDAVINFQADDSPVRFFVGNPKTGGYGLTLTAATTVIYYSNNYELEVRLQSEDRAHRIGQYKSVNYIDLVCEGTVDEKIIKALKDKRKISSEVMGDAWRDWI